MKHQPHCQRLRRHHQDTLLWKSSALELLGMESTTTLGFEVGLQPRARSIVLNISHTCRWFPEILMPSRILQNFLLEVVNFYTTLLCTSRVPSIGHSLGYFVPCEFLVVRGTRCTAFSLHKEIKSVVSSNRYVSAILFNHAL